MHTEGYKSAGEGYREWHQLTSSATFVVA